METQKSEYKLLIKCIQIIIGIMLLSAIFLNMHVIYAEDGDVGNTGETKENTTETKEDTETKKQLETVINKLDSLQIQINEQMEEMKTNEEHEKKLEELQKSVEELQTQVEELTTPEEEETPQIEILDTEMQYQYFPYIMVIISLLMIMTFRRKAS